MSSYILQSGKKVTLTDKDYLAEGGEGRIYAKNGLAHKICNKPVDVRKMAELHHLDASYIVRPLEFIYDGKIPIGYTMNLLDTTKVFPLGQLFTKAFKDREHIGNNDVLNLVKHLKEGFQFVHSKQCLIVDANEFNFMVDRSLRFSYFIDLNSYQTATSNATAIMSSIRDWQSTSFSELTDWFSFGVLTFQMFVGLHPFRSGNHPAVTAKDVEQKLKERCLKNLSVLNSSTKYPLNAVQPFSNIPKGYLDWYTAMFEQGKRCVPPNDFQATIAVLNKVASHIGAIKYTSITKLDGKYRGYHDGRAWSDTEIIDLRTNKRTILPLPNTVFADESSFFHEGHEGADQIVGQHLKRGEAIYKLTKIGPRHFTQKIADCSQHATKVFRGGFVQNWFGSNIFGCFMDGGIHQVNLAGLKGHKVVEAYHEKGILIVESTFNKETFNSIVQLKTDNYCQTHKTNSLNLIIATVKNSGLLLMKDENGDLLLKMGNSEKIVKDSSLDDVIDIFSFQNNTYFIKNDGEILRGML